MLEMLKMSEFRIALIVVAALIFCMGSLKNI